MIALALEGVAASAVLMLLVLAIRAPVRRAFGPHVAYALWAIPVLRLLLPPLPAAWRSDVTAPIAHLGQETIVMILPDAAALATDVAAAPLAGSWGIGPVVLAAWLGGAALFLAWQVARYAAFCRRVLADGVELERVGAIAIVESGAAHGPLAFGLARRVVAFPRDFAARFDAQERELALAHELGHHRRGDIAANWVALAMLALHWFNPVAWFAFRAFRADQEMANDAGVLARRGAAARHAYGCAIVKAAHGHAVTAACHLHDVKDLKGRLRMLGKARAGRTRTLLGTAAAGSFGLVALGATASGTQAAERVREQVETATGIEIAALTADLQAVPTPPPAPGASGAPLPPAPPAPTAGKTAKKVVVVRDGKTRTYEGAAADAYLATHDLPLPPAPPAPSAAPGRVATSVHVITDSSGPANGFVPPVPPVPPVPHVPPVPRVSSRDCATGEGGGRHSFSVAGQKAGQRTIVICNNRIEQAAQRAAAARLRAADVERRALQSAAASLERARLGLAANTRMAEEHRAAALAGIDESLGELRADMASDHGLDD